MTKKKDQEDCLTNFIPISRKLFKNELWEENREFSKFEAWLDLIQTARFEDDARCQIINNKPVYFGRGQLIASVRFLKERWNWGSNTKVESFLNMLKNKDSLEINIGQGVSVITICKYDDYNTSKNDKKTPIGQGQGQQKDKSNKENKDKEGNIINNITSGDKSTGVVVVEKELTHIQRTRNFIDFFNNRKLTPEGNPSKYQATESINGHLRARLKDYKSAQIIKALNQALLDPYHIEKLLTYVTPEYILRPKTIEKYLNSNFKDSNNSNFKL